MTEKLAPRKLLSHHILTPNELICLPLVVYCSLDQPFICLPNSKMTSLLTFKSVNFICEF